MDEEFSSSDPASTAARFFPLGSRTGSLMLKGAETGRVVRRELEGDAGGAMSQWITEPAERHEQVVSRNDLPFRDSR